MSDEIAVEKEVFTLAVKEILQDNPKIPPTAFFELYRYLKEEFAKYHNLEYSIIAATNRWKAKHQPANRASYPSYEEVKQQIEELKKEKEAETRLIESQVRQGMNQGIDDWNKYLADKLPDPYRIPFTKSQNPHLK